MKIKCIENPKSEGYVMVDLTQVSAFCKGFIEFQQMNGYENGGADFVPVCNASLIRALGSVDWASLYSELLRNEYWFNGLADAKEVSHE